MAFEIKKILMDGVEFLPDITTTCLWAFLDIDRSYGCKKSERQLAGLYQAICKRENYFQEYTPTPFGNPEYNLLVGEVNGFLKAMEAVENLEKGQIVIRKETGHQKILVVDKVNRPKRYYDICKENRDSLKAMGF